MIRLSLRVKELASREAERSSSKLNAKGRTSDEVAADAYMGWVGEAHHNELRGELERWATRQDELYASGTHDDGGTDTLDGVNVKTIPYRAEVVLVSDVRAENYVVYEYDVRGFIKPMGTFTRDQIHDVQFGGNMCGRGVYVSELLS